MLPGLSGIEVLEELRNDAALESIPVVVITAWSHAELDAQVAGADRFVSKPFDPDELEHRSRGAARMTLARRMWLASAALALLVGAASRRSFSPCPRSGRRPTARPAPRTSRPHRCSSRSSCPTSSRASSASPSTGRELARRVPWRERPAGRRARQSRHARQGRPEPAREAHERSRHRSGSTRSPRSRRCPDPARRYQGWQDDPTFNRQRQVSDQ